MENYETILGTADIDDAIAASEEELRAGGEPLDAKSALDALKRKHFG